MLYALCGEFLSFLDGLDYFANFYDELIGADQNILIDFFELPDFMNYLFQDILREKSNHIEKIIKERETDREEMAAQTILFQKNIEQVKFVKFLLLCEIFNLCLLKKAEKSSEI